MGALRHGVRRGNGSTVAETLSQAETPDRIDWRARISASKGRLLLGTIVGAVAFVLACRGVNWTELLVSVRNIDGTWAVAALVALGFSLAAAATRWWLLFWPRSQEVRWWSLTAALVVGQMVNVAIPARLGELARVYMVGARESVSRVKVLSTIVVEKVTDLGMLAAGISLLLWMSILPDSFRRAGIASVATAAFGVAAAIGVAFFGPLAVRMMDKAASKLPERLQGFVRRHLPAAVDGFVPLRNARVAAGVWALAAVVFSGGVATNWLLFKASRIDLPVSAALLLFVVLQMGEAPPSLPGKIGVFHYLVVLSLSFFGISRTPALAYAFVLYAVAVIPKLVAGALVVALFRTAESRRPAKRV